jgi:T-complex protein 1 subunit beta
VELEKGNSTAGINMVTGEIDNMEKLGIQECYRVKEQAITAASEAAELIMRVDDVVRCAPRRRDRA